MMTSMAIILVGIVMVMSKNAKTHKVKTFANKFEAKEDQGNATLKGNDLDTSFLRSLFQKYGKEEIMTFEGLEHLLDNLGLGHVASFGHDIQSHIDENGNFVEFHSEHRHNSKLRNHKDDMNSSGISETREMSTPRNTQLISHNANISCLSAKEILRTFHIQYDGGIQTSEFLLLCPALVYQLDQQLCQSRTYVKHVFDGGEINNSFYLNPWVGAFMAVGIVSLAGFFVVGIIPWIADCSFYNNLIQILISLAVGTLTADALLHLLPHAMVPHHLNHSHSLLEVNDLNHDKHPVWVGVVTFGAILVFFVVERFLKIFSEANDCRNSEKVKRHVQLKFMEKDIANIDGRPSEMIYLKNSNVMEFHEDGCLSSIEKLRELTVLQSHDFDDNSFQNHHEIITQDDNEDNNGQCSRDHPHNYDGGHNHNHVTPSSIGSVAWMVIMGDGLHNFTDGLAIGASFSSNVAIGISTSIAVLCHELPHELGDFAMLLKSGMSLKQAFICNFLSSILCFLGASLGIAIGNIDSVTSWIFSITAGIFIYIALVDMLPQVTSVYDSVASGDVVDCESHKEKVQQGSLKKNNCKGCSHPKLAGNKMGTLSYLTFHTLGFLTGLSLMLIIAVYEDQIKIEIN